MTTALQPIKENKLTVDAVPITRDEIENKVRSLKAEEIDAMARGIVGVVMKRLVFDIDVHNFSFLDLKNRDTDGREFPVYVNRYDPQSRVMQFLFPQVVQLLENTFSSPSQFFDAGVKIPLLESNKEGFLDTISDGFLSARVDNGKKKVIQDLMLNSLTMSLHLKLNEKRTKEQKELIFDVFELINGAQVGHSGGSVKNYEEDMKINRC